jgi:hypothetical protein
VLADITDQKRVEERLRVAQTAGGVGSFEYLSGYGTAEVSEQFCRLLGLQPATSLPVRTINAVVHPDDPPIIRGVDGQHPFGRPSTSSASARRQRRGTLAGLARRVSAGSAGGVSFIGVIYDITATKRSEEQLRLLTETLEERVAARTQERDRVWNLSRDLLHVIGADGSIARPIRPGRTCWATTGRPGRRPDGQLVHPDDGRAPWNAAVLSRGEPWAISTAACGQGRTYRWINWTAMPEGDAIYGVGRDVTQRKRWKTSFARARRWRPSAS